MQLTITLAFSTLVVKFKSVIIEFRNLIESKYINFELIFISQYLFKLI